MAEPPIDIAERFRRRLQVLAGVVVGVSALGVALITAVASGELGDLGLPTNAQGQPRGLVVIAAATVVVAAAVTATYRWASAPVGDLLRAAQRVAVDGGDDVSVEVRGPRELRLLAVTFNQMVARLATSDEQRRRFLADVTHELRNPLAVLQSGIEAQLDGVHPRDDRHLQSLLDETRRLGQLVDDLHTLALSEAGRLVLRRQPEPTVTVLDDARARHEPSASLRGVTVRVVLEPGLPPVWIDRRRVDQVVDNLLANAVRHTPAGGEVTVAAAIDRHGAASEVVRCTVSDAGPGFPPARLAHVFERFTPGGDSRGSGLGLSIVRDLVEAHGGRVEARNDPAGGGASVSFTLPLAREATEVPVSDASR